MADAIERGYGATLFDLQDYDNDEFELMVRQYPLLAVFSILRALLCLTAFVF